MNPQTSLRVSQTLARVQALLSVHEQLGRYASTLQVSVEDTAIVLRGELPSETLRGELVPTIRQAGCLWRVNNEVHVAA
jgi:hypothetical protein